MAREATAPVSPAASAMVVTNSQLRLRRLRGGGAGVSGVAECWSLMVLSFSGVGRLPSSRCGGASFPARLLNVKLCKARRMHLDREQARHVVDVHQVEHVQAVSLADHHLGRRK